MDIGGGVCAEGSIAKILDPGPDLEGLVQDGRLAIHDLQRAVDDLVGMLVGDRVAKRVRAVVARIDHRVEVVDVRHDHLGTLPDSLVVLGDEADREDIGAKEGMRRGERIRDHPEEALDRRQPKRLRVGQRGVGGVVVAVAIEADVVELDFVKALVGEVDRDLGDVLGDPRLKWVEPDVAAEVCPGLARLHVLHGQLRS